MMALENAIYAINNRRTPMSKTDWIQQEIENLQSQGLYNRIRTIGSDRKSVV